MNRDYLSEQKILAGVEKITGIDTLEEAASKPGMKMVFGKWRKLRTPGAAAPTKPKKKKAAKKPVKKAPAKKKPVRKASVKKKAVRKPTKKAPAKRRPSKKRPGGRPNRRGFLHRAKELGKKIKRVAGAMRRGGSKFAKGFRAGYKKESVFEDSYRDYLIEVSSNPVARAKERMVAAFERGGFTKMVKATKQRINACKNKDKLEGIITAIYDLMDDGGYESYQYTDLKNLILFAKHRRDIV